MSRLISCLGLVLACSALVLSIPPPEAIHAGIPAGAGKPPAVAQFMPQFKPAAGGAAGAIPFGPPAGIPFGPPAGIPFGPAAAAAGAAAAGAAAAPTTTLPPAVNKLIAKYKAAAAAFYPPVPVV